MSCSYRAAFDRALATGDIVLPPEIAAEIEAAKTSSPNADLGTVIHWLAQTGLGAQFPGPSEKYRFTPEQLANAAALFDGNAERCLKAARQAAERLAEVIGAGAWLAEPKLSRPWMSGHVDLLDPETGVLADIKTTSKPPYYTHIPPSHLIQCLAYAEALGEVGHVVKLIRVVYIDAQASQWWMDCHVDAASDEMMEYRKLIRAYAKRLQRKSYLTDATPNVGDPCEKWCPYVGVCRDRYNVKKGDVQRPPPPTVRMAMPFASPKIVGTAS